MESPSISIKSLSGDKKYGDYMPAQKTSSKEKQSEDWQNNCVNYIIGKGFSTNSGGRTSRHEKLINYNLLNSKYK